MGELVEVGDDVRYPVPQRASLTGVEWIFTGVLVPLVIAAVTALGATRYATYQADVRERRRTDDAAIAAVRAYIRELRNLSVYLEEVEIAGSHWDPARSVIDPGSEDAVRDAYRKAAPYFHRLDVRKDERAATSNSMPDPGDSAMDGSDNFAKRANLLQKVLERGLVAG